MSLLPYNATKLEKAVEYAIKYNVDVSLLSGFKFKTAGDNINLALSWEYSLSQIAIDDFRNRVIEGLKFHRLQGTPYSLRQAFSWYGFNNIKIEEEVPGEHFSEFQVGVNEIPNNLDIEKIVSVSELAAPLRSRLSRMYNDLYDVRRFVLDESEWGCLLSDHFGNELYPGSPKFSFGRVNNFMSTVSQPSLKRYNVRVHYAFAENMDTYKLDWTILGESDVGTLNHDMSRKAHRFMFNTDSVCDAIGDVFETRKFAKALPILSEDAVLGDINTCLSGGYETVEEERFILSYSYLSEHPVIRNQVLVACREFRSHLQYLKREDSCVAIRGYKTNVTCLMCNLNYTINSYGLGSRYSSATYYGNNKWHDQKHFDIPWCEQKNCLGKLYSV